MRELSEEAMGVIAGGCYNGTCAACQEATEIDEVIINGQRTYDRWRYPGSWGYTYQNTGFTPYIPNNDPGASHGGYTGVGEQAGYADTSSIDLEIDIPRELTEDEQWAVDKLRQVIDETTVKINALPDDVKITMPDGSEVLGSELKALWAKVDFLIVDGSGTQFNNDGTGRADRNNGNPLFTIDINGNGTPTNTGLMGYMNSPETQYLYVLHELAHVTMAGHNNFLTNGNSASTEAFANSLARGIAQASGSTWYDDYTPTHGFAGTATVTTGSTGGGGTSGGSGDIPITLDP